MTWQNEKWNHRRRPERSRRMNADELRKRPPTFVLLAVEVLFSCANSESKATQVPCRKGIMSLAKTQRAPRSDGIVARSFLALLACLAREPVFGCGPRPRWAICVIRCWQVLLWVGLLLLSSPQACQENKMLRPCSTAWPSGATKGNGSADCTDLRWCVLCESVESAQSVDDLSLFVLVTHAIPSQKAGQENEMLRLCSADSAKVCGHP